MSARRHKWVPATNSIAISRGEKSSLLPEASGQKLPKRYGTAKLEKNAPVAMPKRGLPKPRPSCRAPIKRPVCDGRAASARASGLENGNDRNENAGPGARGGLSLGGCYQRWQVLR
jgi:hypothetical protein